MDDEELFAGEVGDLERPEVPPLPWYQQLPYQLTVWIVGCLLLAGAIFTTPLSCLRGDTDIFGNYLHEQALEAEREAYEGLELVHAVLFPRWLIHVANQGAHAPVTQEAYDALMHEVTRSDAVLVTYLQALQAELQAGDTGARLESISAILGQWNSRLHELEEPWRIEGGPGQGLHGIIWVSEFYEILHRSAVKVGDLEVPVAVVRRVDQTNVVEYYLGAARPGTDLAIVVVDRTLEFIVDELLPLFDQERPLEGLAANWGPSIISTFTERLPAEALATLAVAAGHRQQIVDTVAEIEGRQSCGSTLAFHDVPWNGFSARTLDQLAGMAQADRLEPCPRVKHGEVDVLRRASRALQRDSDLPEALGRVLSAITRDIAVHEARHVADDRLYNGLVDPMPCHDCPPRYGAATRAEISAYVAGFAWGDFPASAIFQACSSARAAGGAHRNAMGMVLHTMGIRCDQPAEELRALAQDAEFRLFERREPIALDPSFPEVIRF